MMQYSPWEAEVQLYLILRRKLKELLNRWNNINHAYADRPIRHKILRKARRNLVTLTPTQSSKSLKMQKNSSTQKYNTPQENNNPHPITSNW